jgi:hypothetical protein
VSDSKTLLDRITGNTKIVLFSLTKIHYSRTLYFLNVILDLIKYIIFPLHCSFVHTYYLLLWHRSRKGQSELAKWFQHVCVRIASSNLTETNITVLRRKGTYTMYASWSL